MSPSNVIVASSVMLASKNTPYINAAADATAACRACWGNHSEAKSNGRKEAPTPYPNAPKQLQNTITDAFTSFTLSSSISPSSSTTATMNRTPFANAKMKKDATSKPLRPRGRNPPLFVSSTRNAHTTMPTSMDKYAYKYALFTPSSVSSYVNI